MSSPQYFLGALQRRSNLQFRFVSFRYLDLAGLAKVQLNQARSLVSSFAVLQRSQNATMASSSRQSQRLEGSQTFTRQAEFLARPEEWLPCGERKSIWFLAEAAVTFQFGAANLSPLLMVAAAAAAVAS